MSDGTFGFPGSRNLEFLCQGPVWLSDTSRRILWWPFISSLLDLTDKTATFHQAKDICPKDL